MKGKANRKEHAQQQEDIKLQPHLSLLSLFQSSDNSRLPDVYKDTGLSSSIIQTLKGSFSSDQTVSRRTVLTPFPFCLVLFRAENGLLQWQNICVKVWKNMQQKGNTSEENLHRLSYCKVVSYILHANWKLTSWFSCKSGRHVGYIGVEMGFTVSGDKWLKGCCRSH